MPRKKKDPNEMTDAELLRTVFPERVAKEIERKVGLRNAEDDDHEPDSQSPDKDSL